MNDGMLVKLLDEFSILMFMRKTCVVAEGRIWEKGGERERGQRDKIDW